MNKEKIEEKIDNRFRDLFELFDKIKIIGKNSTIIMYGKEYYVSCSIKPITKNLTKHNSRTIQSAKKKKLGEERGKQFLKSLGHGKSIYEVAD